MKREAEEAERLKKQQQKDDEALKKDIEKNHSPKKSAAPAKLPSQDGSAFSGMQVNEDGMKNFKNSEMIEVPPNADSRRFNECDIIGNLDRDEKGNVIAGEADSQGKFKDKKG